MNYLKKDGLINKNYIETSKLLLTCHKHHAVITSYIDVIDEFDCYTVSVGGTSYQRKNFMSKVKNILDFYGYSYRFMFNIGYIHLFILINDDQYALLTSDITNKLGGEFIA